MISVALLLFPGLGLAMLGCKTVAEFLCVVLLCFVEPKLCQAYVVMILSFVMLLYVITLLCYAVELCCCAMLCCYVLLLCCHYVIMLCCYVVVMLFCYVILLCYFVMLFCYVLMLHFYVTLLCYVVMLCCHVMLSCYVMLLFNVVVPLLLQVIVTDRQVQSINLSCSMYNSCTLLQCMNELKMYFIMM